MNIWILDNNPQKIPELLADNDLDFMIMGLCELLVSAQPTFDLCGAQMHSPKLLDLVPLIQIKAPEEYWLKVNMWKKWIATCEENYIYLANLGLACCKEYSWRLSDDYADNNYPGGFCKTCQLQHSAFIPEQHQLERAVKYCCDNVPQLPLNQLDYTYIEEPRLTPFPITIPDEFNYPVIPCNCNEIAPEFVTCNYPLCDEEVLFIENNKRYYAHTLKGKEYKYTRRNQPEFL